MELKRRFLFHGDAVAIGGRIVRPNNIVLDPLCASTLPVTGGRTSNRTKGLKFGKYVSFASASTLAEGQFDDRKQVVEVTKGNAREEDLKTTTSVRAELLGLIAGTKPRLEVKRLRGALVSKSPTSPDDEMVVALGKEVAIDGVSIGGHKLIVELNKTIYQEHDTFAKLKRAVENPGFVEKNAYSLAVGATVSGQPKTPGLIEARGVIHCTIVRNIRWSGKPYPGATIDGHLVTVPDFGRIYFGELLIRRGSRRLTMLRVEFGSPFGGSMAAADVQDDGGWSP
jgi:hypothetical protein